jgi:hypothetical protein
MSHTENLIKSQDDIDREEFIAGTKLGQELINAAMLNPGKVDQEQMMRQIQSLMTPKRFKDLSPKDLRKMAFDAYVENASIAMMKNINENTYHVNIPKQHASIAEELTIHWRGKGFKVDVTKEHHPLHEGDGNKINVMCRIIAISLTW